MFPPPVAALLLLAACVGSKPDSDGDDTGSAGDGGGPVDADLDGSPATEDCDDEDPDIHPGADEVCGNGEDRDCDGMPAGCTGVMPASAMAGMVEGDDATWWTGKAVVVAEGWDPGGEPTVVVSAAGATVDAGTGEAWYAAGSLFGMAPDNLESADGVAEVAQWRIDAAGPDVVFGYRLSAGDMDGDGIVDLMASGPHGPNHPTHTGELWVIPGPLIGDAGLSELGAVQILGEEEWDGMGWGLAWSPDATGDGISDIVVTSLGDCDNLGGDGGFYVLRDRLDDSRAVDLGDPHYVLPEVCLGGGSSLAVTDLDGDGVDDAAYGALFGGTVVSKGPGGIDIKSIGPGYVYIQLGPLTDGGSLADADAVLVGPESNSLFGRAVALGDDLDGDGGPDLLLGAPYADASADHAGLSWAVSGRAAVTGSITRPEDAAIATFSGDRGADLQLGYGMSGAGDMDRDGAQEVMVVGQALEDKGTYSGRGQVYLFRGPIGGTLTPDDALLRIDGNHGADRLGFFDDNGGALFGRFDLNDDAFDDIIIGAEIFGEGEMTGAAYLLYGGAWD